MTNIQKFSPAIIVYTCLLPYFSKTPKLLKLISAILRLNLVVAFSLIILKLELVPYFLEVKVNGNAPERLYRSSEFRDRA
jgi:hypothetical protein